MDYVTVDLIKGGDHQWTHEEKMTYATAMMGLARLLRKTHGLSWEAAMDMTREAVDEEIVDVHLDYLPDGTFVSCRIVVDDNPENFIGSQYSMVEDLDPVTKKRVSDIADRI